MNLLENSDGYTGEDERESNTSSLGSREVQGQHKRLQTKVR